MAAAFVKKSPTGNTPNGGGAGTSAQMTFAADAAGNIVVVTLTRWREAAGTLTAASISDTQTNTWHKTEVINTRDGIAQFFCYAKNTSSMDITASWTDSAYWTIEVTAEASGIATGLTAGASGSNTGSGSSTAPSSGAVSPSGNCLYVGGCEFDEAVTCSEASGWTLSHEDESWSYSAGASAYRIGSGSQTASWTLGGDGAKWTALVVAYAEASATIYTVTYDGNSNTSGTAPTDSNSPYDSGETVTTLTNSGNLARTGYAFNGWNTAANGGGTHYNTGATFTISANTTLYAEWSPRYSVTYNGNSNTSGSVPTDSNAYASGATVTVLGNTGSLARTGYSWEGWNTAANGSGTHYDASDTFNISANTTLYAEWDETPVGTIGDYADISVGSETIRMIIASNISSVTFPTGTDDAGSESLTHRLYMQETALTNAQAVAILQWAYDHSKFNTSDSGAHNYLSSATVRWGAQELFDLDSTGNGTETYNIQIAYSAGVFSVRNSMGDYPVVHNSWYGAVMICNWLTEMKDGDTDNLVYTGIDTTWVANETTVDFSKTGYRLPTRAEWWYSARYRGADSTNTVSGYTSPYFTQGDSASGATADYTNATATAAVAVYNVSALAAVKTKTANALGLYDMSGNVWEWLENYSTASAYDIGGAWDNSDAAWCRIGTESSNTADDSAFHVGFRIAKTYTEVLSGDETTVIGVQSANGSLLSYSMSDTQSAGLQGAQASALSLSQSLNYEIVIGGVNVENPAYSQSIIQGVAIQDCDATELLTGQSISQEIALGSASAALLAYTQSLIVSAALQGAEGALIAPSMSIGQAVALLAASGTELPVAMSTAQSVALQSAAAQLLAWSDNYGTISVIALQQAAGSVLDYGQSVSRDVALQAAQAESHDVISQIITIMGLQSVEGAGLDYGQSVAQDVALQSAQVELQDVISQIITVMGLQSVEGAGLDVGMSTAVLVALQRAVGTFLTLDMAIDFTDAVMMEVQRRGDIYCFVSEKKTDVLIESSRSRDVMIYTERYN